MAEKRVLSGSIYAVNSLFRLPCRVSFKLESIFCCLFFCATDEFPLKLFKMSMQPFVEEEGKSENHPPCFIKESISEIKDWFANPAYSLPTDKLDISSLSVFETQILCELRKNVLPGKTVSYKELASICGVPNAARAVGNAMKRNPFPLFFPCHRVVRADGDIGGFSCGSELKQILLEKEHRIFSIKK